MSRHLRRFSLPFVSFLPPKRNRPNKTNLPRLLVETLEDRTVPSATLSVSDVTVIEGDSGTVDANFTISLSEAVTEEVTVTYETSDGSATTADNDYLAASGSVTFTPGGPLTQTVTVTVNGDTNFELDEDFTVNLTNVEVGSTTTVLDFPFDEDFEFERKLRFNNAPGEDFTNAFFISADGLYLVEAFRYIPLPGATTAQKEGIFHVADNDNDLTDVAELNRNLRGNSPNPPIIQYEGIRITRLDGGAFILSQMHLENEAAIGDITNLITGEGTYTLFQNHSPTTIAEATVSFGNQFANVTSVVLADPGMAGSSQPAGSVNVWDNIVLTTAPVVTVLDGEGVGIIQNDDEAPTISINDVSVVEGDSGTVTADFTVELSGASILPVTVDFQTADGSATTADNDYGLRSGSLQFDPGETKKTVTVRVRGDINVEPDENFFVRLSSPSGATLDDDEGVGTILNDDQPTISIDNVSVLEGDSGTVDAVFTVTLSAPSPEMLSFNYQTVDGSAMVADNDYVPNSGTIDFAPNQMTTTITVKVNGDINVEPDETFLVELADVAQPGVVVAAGTGTILNDDQIVGSHQCFDEDESLIIDGTDEDDHIRILPAKDGNVRVWVNKEFRGVLDPKKRIIVNGFEGDDFIHVAGSIKADAWLFGDEGNDKLHGGKGNDILVGGEGKDQLLGKQGRDLLIGGLGSDHLVGNPHDDILIAGFTDFDSDFEALCRIMEEWTSDRSFETRVANLTDGTGSADPANLPYFLTSDTVHDDGVKDRLTGASGRDWFFASLSGPGKDKVSGFHSAREELTSI